MRAKPLRRFPLHHTHDLDAVGTVLSEWGITDYAITDRSYRYYINLAALRDITLTYGTCSSRVQMTFSGVGFMRHRICLSGTGRLTAGDFSSDLNPRRWSAIVPAGESGSIDFNPDYEELRMVVDDGLMRRKLGALIGDGPVDRIEFSRDDSVRSPHLARYRRLLSFLLSELDVNASEKLGSVVDEVGEAVLVSYMFAQGHNYSHRLLKQEQAPSKQQLRIVEDFIAANWNEALSIEAIAAATNVSARSIFRCFQQTHGCSPFQYIKRIRLDHARAMFLQDEQQSVIGVALKCGFQSFGHFASSYRDAFGELPSQTRLGRSLAYDSGSVADAGERPSSGAGESQA